MSKTSPNEFNKDLDSLIVEVQRNLRKKGFDLPKSDITSFTVDLVRRKFDDVENNISEQIGTPNEIASLLLEQNSDAWPVNHWFHSRIVLDELKPVNLRRVSIVMQSTLYVHLVLGVLSTVLGFILLFTSVNGLRNRDVEEFRKYNDWNNLVYFPFLLFSLYLITSRISKSPSLRVGYADMFRWRLQIFRLSYLHRFAYGMFGIYLIVGSSLRDLTLNDRDKWNTPANGTEFTTMIPIVLISYYGLGFVLRFMKNYIDGPSLRNKARKNYRSKGYLIHITLNTFYKIVILGVVYLTSSVIKFYIEVYLDDFTDVSGLEFPQILGMIVYVLFNGIYILIRERNLTGDYQSQFLNSFARANRVYILSWLVYLIVYVFVMVSTYRRFALEANVFRFIFESGIVFMVPFVVIFYIGSNIAMYWYFNLRGE